MLTTKITPQDINLKRSFMDSVWKNSETEVSAYFLCKLAHNNKSWKDFTKKQIDSVAEEDFWFNYLRRDRWDESNSEYDSIIFNPHPKKRGLNNGTFSFTDKFIEECYRLTNR